MIRRLFYAWLPEDADAKAKSQGEAVIAGLKSPTVAIDAIEGGYSISVEGPDATARESAARLVATNLRNEGGFLVGQNSPLLQRAALPAAPRPPRTGSTQSDESQAVRLLKIMQAALVHELTLNLLCSRMQLGRAAVRRCLRILVGQRLVEELPRDTYRLTEQGRQAT